MMDDVEIFAGAGSAVANSANPLTPEKPADATNGDDLYLHVAIYAARGGHDVTTPAGFVLVAKQDTGADTRHWLYHRSADGTEPPSWDIGWAAVGAGGGTRLGLARCYAVRGHKRGNSIGRATAGSGTAIAAPTLTASGSPRTGLCLVALRVAGETPPSVGEITGQSGGSWSKRHEFVSPDSILHQKGMLSLYAADASATTIGGGTATSSISGEWTTMAAVAGSDTDIGAGDVDLAPRDTDVGGDRVLPSYDVSRTPEQHGALGDGTADDASAIQKMLDWVQNNASAAKKVGIEWGAGKTYLIGAKLDLKGASHFYHIGNGATIARHEGWNLADFVSPQPLRPKGRMLIQNNCTDWGMYDLTFDGRRAESGNLKPVRETHHSLQCQGGNNFEIKRCTFKNGQGDGFQITRNGVVTDTNTARSIPHDYLIEDVVSINNYRNNCSNDYGYHGVYRNCTFQGANGTNPRAGLDIEPLNAGEPVTVPGAMDILIQKCRFVDNDALGLMLTGDSSEGTLQDITVDDCTFIGNSKNKHSKFPEWGQMFIRNCTTGIVVKGCTFRDLVTPPLRGKTKYVILIHNQVDPDINIRGNTFRNNTGAAVCIGMRHNAGQTSRNILIEENTFDISAGLSTGSDESGASNGPCAVAVCWSNVQVLKNTIIGTNATMGIVFERPSTNRPNGAKAENNTIRDCGIGVQIRKTVASGHEIDAKRQTFVNCDFLDETVG